MGDAEHVASGYRRFAAEEAERSPLYAEWAAGVAGDEEILRWLAGLPRGKRQPNLLFASVRLLAGAPAGFAAFRAVVRERRAEIEVEILARRTQTNEPARCGVLLPALAALPQPLALLEVGASAGLCLLPDRYAYDYAGHRVGNGGPLLRCRPEGGVPLPDALPRVVWRAGLDLAPIDVHDADAVRWLELLVWPGEEYRLVDLRGALAVARQDPPRIVRGDLVTDLPALAAEAPPRRHPRGVPHGGAGLRAVGGPHGVRGHRAVARRGVAGQRGAAGARAGGGRPGAGRGTAAGGPVQPGAGPRRRGDRLDRRARHGGAMAVTAAGSGRRP